MTDREWYDYGQGHCGIEVGDSIKVLRKAEDREMGWGTVWSPSMDKFIGQTLKVNQMCSARRGFDCGSERYTFPFFVLELVKKVELESPLPQSILDIIDSPAEDFGCAEESIKKLVAEILKQK